MSPKHALAILAALAAASTTVAAEPATVISGKAFVNYSARDNQDDGTNAAADKKNGTALDLKRFYLGVDHAFDDVWAARIRTDVGNEVQGKYDVFVKNAYVQATVAPELAIRAGAADMPWIPFVEDLYGFRYVENVLVDRLKLGNSADWGVHAVGKLGDGVASYAVSVVNGRGYGDPTRTRAPTVAGRLSVNPMKELTLAVAAEAGKLGQNVPGTATDKTATRYDAVIAWAGGPVRAGVTAFLAQNYDPKIVTGASPEDKAQGGSLWASYLIEKVTLFGRVDYVQPHETTNKDAKDLYVNGGISYKAAKPIDLALVYKYEKMKSGSISTSNGTIGSAIAGENGTYQELGVFAQYAF